MLLASLQKLPGLETLHLENYLPFAFAPESSIVALPKLTSLVLADTPRRIRGFFNFLRAPELDDVDIEFGDENLPVDVLNGVFLALRASQAGDYTLGLTSVQPQAKTLHIQEIGAAARYSISRLGRLRRAMVQFQVLVHKLN